MSKRRTADDHKGKPEIDKVSKESMLVDETLLDGLQELVPEAFTEGKIDWEKLKLTLGEEVDERLERYNFTWAGKRDAIRLLQVPSRATLVPVKDESVNWDTTKNIFIEGENLEVLKLLLKPYFGRVKMIYIDPPYNTGKDFIYKDDYKDPLGKYLEMTGQKDSEGNLQTSNPETSGRYHSDWLSMMYPRIFLARQLLTDDGVIFISIDDKEVKNLRAICDEIFGEENFLGTLVWKNATDNNPTNVTTEHEYIHVYCRNKNAIDSIWKSTVSDVKTRLIEIGNSLIEKHEKQDELQAAYTKWFKENKAFLWPLDRYKYIDENGVYTGSQSVHNPGKEGYRYDVIHPITGKPCVEPLMGYRFPNETMDQLLEDEKIIFGEDETKIIELKVYAEEFQDKLSSFIDLDGRLGAYDLRQLFPEMKKAFTNPKPVRLIKHFMPFVLKDNDIVIDFFSGSCTTAHAVYEVNREDESNRRFIMIQLPELCDKDTEAKKSGYKTIADIGKERIRRVLNLLGSEKEGELELDNRNLPEDLGFKVFNLEASNYKPWTGTEDKDPDKYIDQMEAFADPLVEGWKPQNVIYEVALKEGYGLNITMEEVGEIKANKILKITDPEKDQSFLLCLDKKLKDETPKKLKLTKDDLFICRDNALTDEQAANLALQCKLKTI